VALSGSWDAREELGAPIPVLAQDPALANIGVVESFSGPLASPLGVPAHTAAGGFLVLFAHGAGT
jgi:hypothetical protein